MSQVTGRCIDTILYPQSGLDRLVRYNPDLVGTEQNPFQLDSKEPDWNKFEQFHNMEVRFLSLKKTFPERARELGKLAIKNAKWRYEFYKRQAAMDFSIHE